MVCFTFRHIPDGHKAGDYYSNALLTNVCDLQLSLAAPDPDIAMTIALRQADTMPINTMARASTRVARVEIFNDMATAEPFWRSLESTDALSTPYQKYDFLNLWQRHVGEAEGIHPFIVIGFDAVGAPVMVLPFGQRRVYGLRAVEFLGGKHSNFNIGMWRRDIAGAISESGIRDIMSYLTGRADALLLINQALTWQGMTNPFALIPYQLSPSMGFSGALSPDFDALFRACTSGPTRKKIRKKEQSLAAFGPVKFEQITDPAETRRVLDIFFKQKSARMRARGITDVFGTAEVRRFIEAAATDSGMSGKPIVEIYALSVGDVVVATMGGMVSDGRYCGMFNSIIPNRFEAESPGEQLLIRLIRACCERGLTTFDLGVGEANYKEMFCKDAEPLFDTYLPLSAAGRLLVAMTRLKTATKRYIKQSPALWSVLCRARKLRAALSAPR